MDFGFGGGMPAMNFMPDWLKEMLQGGGLAGAMGGGGAAAGGANGAQPEAPPMFMQPQNGQLPTPSFGQAEQSAANPQDTLRKQLIMQAIMQQQKQGQPQQAGATLPPVATQMPMGGGGMPNRFAAGSAPTMPGTIPTTGRRRFLGQG